MAYVADIRLIPEQNVYFKEYLVKSMDAFFDEIAEKNFLQELCDKVMQENPHIRLTDPEYNILVFVDGQYKEEDVRFEFCDAVNVLGKATEEYGFKTLPGFMALSIMHKGPYKKLSEAYSFALQWMDKNGYEQAGCPRNSAIDGFWNRDSEDDYLTEVQIPIKNKKSS